MSIKIGTSDVTDIKIGTTNVNTVYIGSTVIWQRGGDVYTYEIHTTVEHSSGGTINAAGSNYATIKTYWRTYINSVLDSEVLTDMSVSITYNPETDHFSVTRTGVGIYKVEADSRGTDAGDSWSCTVGVSYSGENTSESVYQEANNYSTSYSIIAAKLNNYNGNITVGDTANTVNLSGTVRRTYTYTSGSSSYTDIALGSSNYSVSGTGFSYSNSVVSVSANSGAERYGTVYFSYSGAATVSRTITQESGQTYTYDVYITTSYSSGSYINAAGTTYATLQTYLRTYLNGVLDSQDLMDMSVSITYNPSSNWFSYTRTGTGTYRVNAQSRGTTTGSAWSCTVQATHAGMSISDSVSVSQQANAFVSNSNYYISKYLIDGSASNYNASYSSGSVSVYGEYTYTSTYTSGSYSVTEALSASDISFSGAGFSYSNFWISYTLNDTGSTRNCTVYYSHSGASTVTRTITQASVVFPTVITNLAQVSGYGTSATIALSGQVTSWGSGSASSYGIRYKLSSSGTWTNVPCSNISSGAFSVSPDLTGLSAGTYDYQAYATSSVGVTGYGDSNQFTVSSAPSYSISVSPSGYAQNQGGDVQVTVTSSHGWNATVNKGDFFSLSISASSGVSGDTPTISIPTPFADGTYNGNVTFTCGTATHVFYISVTIGL